MKAGYRTILLMLFLASMSFSRAPIAFAEGVEAALTARNIAAFSPRARADILDALVRNRSRLTGAGIDTPRRLYHFMAQIGAETGGLVLLEENLRYSATRLRTVFPSRVNEEQAARLAYRPVDIANHVYAQRLGNGARSTNDGWRYRGSGYMQLTGRANFKARGDELGLPLVDNPDSVRQAETGLITALAYWKARDLNAVVDTKSIVEVRRGVNGGTNGLDHARLWYARAVRAFSPSLGGLESAGESVQQEETEAVSSLLSQMQISSPRGLEGALDDQDLRAGLLEFQSEKGLPETGILDEDTLYELARPDDLHRADQQN